MLLCSGLPVIGACAEDIPHILMELQGNRIEMDHFWLYIDHCGLFLDIWSFCFNVCNVQSRSAGIDGALVVYVVFVYVLFQFSTTVV